MGPKLLGRTFVGVCSFVHSCSLGDVRISVLALTNTDAPAGYLQHDSSPFGQKGFFTE